MRPVHRSLNKVLTLLGGERRLMLLSMFVGMAFFQASSSFILGLLGALFFCGLGWIQARNPVAIRLLLNHWLNPRDHHTRYDSAMRRPFTVVFYENQKSS